jgi:hypothetical protein
MLLNQNAQADEPISLLGDPHPTPEQYQDQEHSYHHPHCADDFGSYMRHPQKTTSKTDARQIWLPLTPELAAKLKSSLAAATDTQPDAAVSSPRRSAFLEAA